MMNMQWYERDGSFYKKRLLREIEFIESFRDNGEIDRLTYGFDKSGNFNVKFRICYQKRFYFIKCVYPILYPKTRIQVYVSEYNRINRVFLPMDRGLHNSKGNLCLLNHFPNEWSEEYGMEFIMKRVTEWFRSGRMDETNLLPFNFNNDNDIFILPEPLLNNLSLFGIFEFYRIRNNLCILKSINYKENTVIAKNIPESLKNDGNEIQKGIILFSDKSPLNKDELKLGFSAIKPYLNHFRYGTRGFFQFANENGIKHPISLIIMFPHHDYQGYSFLILPDKKLAVGRINTLRVNTDIFSREKDVKNLNYLGKKKVAIIGVGSLGSVIASELARSGIKNFLLVDYQKLEIQNIGRHDLTLRDIDKYKVDAVKEKIVDINPEANCIALPLNILEDTSLLLKELLKYDLVISTIDEEDARYSIDSLLMFEGEKAVFAGVFYNAVSGYVIVSDKKIACLSCISRRIDFLAQNKEIPDFEAIVPKDLKYNCGMPTFPGGSVNTHVIAILASRISLDILLGEREVNENGYPFNFYLLGNETFIQGEKRYFNGFMDLRRYVLPGIENCFICGRNPELSDIELEKYTRVMEKINK